MYSFSYLEPVCSMSSSNCCFLTCIQISQEAGQVVRYSHLLQNFPQFNLLILPIYYTSAFLVAQMVKNLPAVFKTWVQSLVWEDPLEKETATHSSILAWRIPWTVAHQAPLSLGFPRQEYWSGLPFPPPEDPFNPGIKPGSPAWQVDSLPLSHQGRPSKALQLNNKKKQPN